MARVAGAALCVLLAVSGTSSSSATGSVHGLTSQHLRPRPGSTLKTAAGMPLACLPRRGCC